MDGEFSDSDDKVAMNKHLAALEIPVMRKTSERGENNKWHLMPSNKKNAPTEEDSWKGCRDQLTNKVHIGPAQRNDTNEQEEDASEPGHSSWQYSGNKHECIGNSCGMNN